MNSNKLNTLTAIVVSALVAPLTVDANIVDVISNHKDDRTFAKIVRAELPANKSATSALDILELYKKELNIEHIMGQLQPVKTKQSLTATHYYFQQTINDIPVWRSEVIVSINKKDTSKVRVFNNTFPQLTVDSSSKAIIDSNKALQLGWQNLQSSGLLLAEPKASLVYIAKNGKAQLSYVTQLVASSPRGDWQQIIDATTGSIEDVKRIDLPTFKNANADMPEGGWVFAENKMSKSFAEALSELEQKQKNKKNSKFTLLAEGSALVFDPDPRTTLNDASLEDDSPSASFEDAYLNRTLNDITFDEVSGIYSLEGPWVQIIDWDPPTSAPSTTSDGNWTAKRGDVAFNDAMTYYHIDLNQRYMQSLGFTGDTGIQELSIEVDANGASGADNSFYSPTPNRMSFGHGCVDDNEDLDVILHEYGHAINFSINSNWGGGDSGAIGEGFGDYWAGSYSYSTPNGATFNPNWVYTWDGHNQCWNGRVMNRTNYEYDSSQTYGAHEIVNGQNGDELWSTPLFQSLIQLIDMGQSREEVDQIILEAQFGLGSGITMPEMAESTVAAAEALYPDGPHAEVFSNNFAQVKILQNSNAPIVSVANLSQTVDAGSTVTLDASNSSDPNNLALTFVWSQRSGTTVSLMNSTSAVASFEAPSLSSNSSLTFRVTVTNSTGNISTQDVTVIVNKKKSSSSGGSLTFFLGLFLASIGFRRKK